MNSQGLYFFLYSLSFILIFLGILVLFVPPPQGPPKCDTSIYDKDCDYVLEKKFDPTIKSLKGKSLNLGDFKYSVTSGGPWCEPSWYSARYIRIFDGGYGERSDWTSTPIFSGSNNLPCVDGGKCANVPSGKQSCTLNEPKLITNFPLDYDLVQGQYGINVHRYIGKNPPSSNEDGQIIGMMLPVNDSRGFTSFYNDFDNPSSDAQWCPGC